MRAGIPRAPLVDGAIGVVVNISTVADFLQELWRTRHCAGHLNGGVCDAYADACASARARGIWRLDGHLAARLLGQFMAALGMAAAVSQMRVFFPPPESGTAFVWVAVMIGLGAVIFGVLAFGFGALKWSDWQRLRRARVMGDKKPKLRRAL